MSKGNIYYNCVKTVEWLFPMADFLMTNAQEILHTSLEEAKALLII